MVLSAAMPDFDMLSPGDEFPRSEHPHLMQAFVAAINKHPEQARSNRMTGLKLIILTEACGYTNVAAYRLVRPESRASDRNAADYVTKLKAHHRKTYPLSINEALDVHGVTIEWVIEKLKKILDAKKLRWIAKEERYEETTFDDYRVQLAAMDRLLKIVNLDEKSRQELAVGKAEMQKMQLNTGPKFETIEEWQEWMKGQHEETMNKRAQAARDMKLIAAGRQIIQEKGQKTADEYRQAALDAGMTGDEPDEEADGAAAYIRELGADL